MRRHFRLIAALVTVGALTATACGGGTDPGESAADASGDSATPRIVATTSILGDITSNVVGDLATVEVIIPADTDPHDFEPSAQQAAELRDAELIIANGLLLEEGLLATLESAEADGVKVLYVGDVVDPLVWDEEGHSEEEGGAAVATPAAFGVSLAGDDHSGEEGHSEEEGHSKDEGHSDEEGDAHGEYDPHFWFDPVRMSTATGAIAEAVAQNTGLDADTLNRQAAAYQAQLAELDAELEAQFATIPAERRLLVTDHDAFGYLAEHYGFEILGTVYPSGSELAEPSAGELADLADLITERGVPAIFSENIASPDLADALAAEVGSEVAVVELFSDSVGGGGSGAETYLAMMRTNGERITGALS